MQKYASNVIEKCLDVCDDNILKSYIDEVSRNNGVLGNNMSFKN